MEDNKDFHINLDDIDMPINNRNTKAKSIEDIEERNDIISDILMDLAFYEEFKDKIDDKDKDIIVQISDLLHELIEYGDPKKVEFYVDDRDSVTYILIIVKYRSDLIEIKITHTHSNILNMLRSYPTSWLLTITLYKITHKKVEGRKYIEYKYKGDITLYGIDYDGLVVINKVPSRRNYINYRGTFVMYEKVEVNEKEVLDKFNYIVSKVIEEQ